MDIEQMWRQLDELAVQLYGTTPKALIEAVAENRRLMGVYQARAEQLTQLPAAVPANAKAQPQGSGS